MNPRHQKILADVERRVRTDGTSLDEIDCRVADELGVPPDYYFAYLLVWAAIEARAKSGDLAEPDWLTENLPEDACDATLLSTIGWHASVIYEETAVLGGPRADIPERASKILDAVLDLWPVLCGSADRPPAVGASKAAVRR